MRNLRVLCLILSCVTVLASGAAAEEAGQLSDQLKESAIKEVPAADVDNFPCTSCHVKGQFNSNRRALTKEHEDLKLDHGPNWCLDCHNAKDRDKLRLYTTGEVIPFEQSTRLCAQCHVSIYRDWVAGIHGKRVGSWNGEKSYYGCVACHNPHSPRVVQLEAFPTPVPPSIKPNVSETAK